MNTSMFLLNALGKVDQAFFLICLLIIVAVVAIYFLIPVFRKSQYKERREKLIEREAAYNKSRAKTSTTSIDAQVLDQANEAEQNEPTSEVKGDTEN